MREIKPKKLSTVTESPQEKVYPSFGIGLEHLPEAKKWEIKGNYRLVLDVTMSGLNIRKGEKDDSGYADFDITGIEVQKRPSKVNRYT